MRNAVHWIVAIAAAGLIVFTLLKLLPPDLARHWVIAIGGLAGILWSKFIDSPKRVGSGIIKMSHYKAGPKVNEGKFPHHVDMPALRAGR